MVGRHPEKIEVDGKLARFIRTKTGESEFDDQLGRAIYEAHFVPPAALALPDMVDGVPGEKSVAWPARDAARRIKAFARRLGADDVRIGPLRREWVYTHKGAPPFFREGYANPPYFHGIPRGTRARDTAIRYRSRTGRRFHWHSDRIRK